jgi:hypothetical protein
MALAASSASAHMFGWFPGSSSDTPESGDRIAIVNLHLSQIIGPTNGFVYTDESAGADPLPPTFSPDGVWAYMIVGGDEASGESKDAHLYVFHANEVHAQLEAGHTPTYRQKIAIPATSSSAVEPTGICVSPTGDKLVITDAQYDKIHVFNIHADGAQEGLVDGASLVSLNTPSDPTPPWIKLDGSKAYVCTSREYSGTDVETEAQLHVIDLAQSPAVLAKSIDIPSPAQGSGILGLVKTIPVSTCAFQMKAGAPYSVQQPAGTTVDGIDTDNYLYVFSGFAGFRAKTTFPVASTLTLNDPFRVYKLDTATDLLTEDGNPLAEITPTTNQVTFPPLIHVYRTGHGSTLIHAGGTTMFEEGGTVRTFTPQDDNYVALYGMLEPAANWYFFGSVAGAQGEGLAIGSYVPLSTSSGLYRASGHSITGGTIAHRYTASRSMTTVLGFVTGRVILGCTDGFFGMDVPGIGNQTVSRKTQVVLYSNTSNTAQTLDLNLVAGAYGQQPVGVIPTAASQVVDHLLGRTKLGVGGDMGHDGRLDSADIYPLTIID